MKRIILHIGRHKTGTTAIQRFLRTNPDLLKSNNYYYPDYGVRGFGHHELGVPITRANLRKQGVYPSEKIRDLRRKLKDEIHDQNNITLISSESFQNCDPKVVKELFSDWQVNVVVYLREQVSYFISAYAQKVHATDYTGTMDEYLASTFSKNYTQFINEWEEVFANDLMIRIYEREELIERSVVIDYCESILNISRDVVKSIDQGSDANPSLTRDLLEFKLFVNRHKPLTDEQAKLLYNGLAKLALTDKSGKISVSDRIVGEMNSRFEQSNRDIARTYFNRDYLFNNFIQPKSRGTTDISNAQLLKIREQLVSISPTLSDSLPVPSL